MPPLAHLVPQQRVLGAGQFTPRSIRVKIQAAVSTSDSPPVDGDPQDLKTVQKS